MSADSPRALQIFLADQKDRESVYTNPDALLGLKQRDLARTQEIYSMMQSDEIRSANDLYHAAVVLQHGSLPSDYLAAHRLSMVSAAMGHAGSRWLCAATLDRYLMSVGLGQVYGTQFEHDTRERKYQLALPVQEQRMLPFEKKFLGVPPAIERLQELNAQLQQGGKHA